MEPIFIFPTKRDVAGMSAQLATIQPEQRIAAVIEADRYGIILIEGPAWINDADEISVGGVHIAKKAVLKKEISLRAPERDIKRVLLEEVEVERGTATAARDIVHGDLVSVDFVQPPHGSFTISGVATAGEGSAFITVGPWIIHDQIGAGSRVVEARVVASAGAHDMPVPARRSANFSAVEGAAESGVN